MNEKIAFFEKLQLNERIELNNNNNERKSKLIRWSSTASKTSHQDLKQKLKNELQRTISIHRTSHQYEFIRPKPTFRRSHLTEILDSLIEENSNQKQNIKMIGDLMVVQSREMKVSHIIEELICSEESYISSLANFLYNHKTYLEDYCPDGLIQELPYLFNNLEDIYLESQNFLNLLKLTPKNAQSIGNAFCDSEHLLTLYQEYIRNKPRTDLYLPHFTKMFQQIQYQLNDRCDTYTYLMTPFQRFTKFVMFIERIKKEESCNEIISALNLVKQYMRRCNDLLVIDTIQRSFIDLNNQGSYIMKEEFRMFKPLKLKVMLFLFELVLIITFQDPKNPQQYNYLRSIKIEDLGIPSKSKNNLLEILDCAQIRQGQMSEGLYTFKAQTTKIHNLWVEILEKVHNEHMEKIKDQNRFSDDAIEYLKILRPINLLISNELQKFNKASLLCNGTSISF